MTESNNRRVFIAATGAGAGAQHDLWKIPGCSSYFCGAAFPYGTDQTDEFLGFKPDKYCSEDTALYLAMESYKRAWNGRDCEAIGIGLSASVASVSKHRGEHEIFASVVYGDGLVASHHQILKKGQGDEARHRDGNKADRMITGLLRFATGKSVESKNFTYKTGEAIELFFKKPFFDVDGTRGPNPSIINGPVTLYPGAFNPVHKGHVAIAEAANAIYNITQDSPHKPPLSLADMLQRAKMLKGKRVLFSRGDPLYIDKARLAPGTTFMIGSDALLRMLDPKWGPEVKHMLYEFVSLYTTFLVAPRIVDGQLLTMDNVLDSCGVDFQTRHDLFKELKIEPSDISSSQIRNSK